MKKDKNKCCSIRFANDDVMGQVPFEKFVDYETQFYGNAWRMQVWTVIFLGQLGTGSKCSGVELWKNWFIDKKVAKNKDEFLAAFRKRLIDEKFDDAVIFDLVEPMTLKQFQEFEKEIESLNQFMPGGISCIKM